MESLLFEQFILDLRTMLKRLVTILRERSSKWAVRKCSLICFESMPKVLLTRPRIRSSSDDELHHILSAAGVTIEELPMISFDLPKDTIELDRSLERAAIGKFDLIILSS